MKLTKTIGEKGREPYQMDEVSPGDIGRADGMFLRFVRNELRGLTFVNSFTAEDFDELARKRLVEEARKARDMSYSPYSSC